MAEDQKYNFDIVVTRFEPAASTADRFTDIAEIKIVVQFNGKNLKISKSRINVDDFKPNSSLEFKATANKIRKNLEECGIPVQFNYSNKLEGIGVISIPQASIDAIEDNMSDWIFTGTCNVEEKGQIVGTVDILCRLIVKCDEPKQDSPKACKNIEEAVNRNDIMFVMTDSQRNANACDPCTDMLPQEEGDQLLQLDIERYQAFQEALKSTKVFTHSPAGNAACCEIKKMALECEEVVDSIIRNSGQPMPLKKPCRHPPESTCTGPNLDYFPQVENPLTSPLVPCFSYLPARKEEPADFCSPNFIPVPISDLAKPMIKPIRFCPVCLTDMSWLPKFANCPSCGVKAMPVVEERHKNKALKADDIIDEHLGKQNRSIDYYCKDPCNPAAAQEEREREREQEQEQEEENKCYCTCKFGKLCAHCRIRNMVEDIFKVDKKLCPARKSQDSEDVCMVEDDENNCRPYLARVFSEMRDLYNINDTKRPSDDGTPPTVHHPKAKVRKDHPDLEVRPTGLPEKQEKLKWLAKKPKPASRIPKNKHKYCVRRVGRVGRRHGWSWHLAKEAINDGWQPGWVRKSVKKIMKFFLHPNDSPSMFCKKKAEEEAEKQRMLPTLNLKKKDGVTYVTLRPLNDRNIQMHPIVFKITKSEKAVAVSHIKAVLKAKGFPKCTCHQTVMMCNCRYKHDKKRLEAAVQQESMRHCIENCVDQLVLTDTSDTEMEYDLDFPTEAGGNSAAWPPPKKAIKVNKGTQFDKKDLVVTPKYPVKLNPYWRAYDCAAGDRYTGTAFGAPGEEVFEDGIFGFGGGGPHGPSSGGLQGPSGGGPMRGGALGGGRAGGRGGGMGGGRGGRGAGGGAFGGPGGGAFGGPGGAFGGAFGGKGFPGAKRAKGEKPPPAPPIPVRMTDKYYKQVEDAEKAKKDKIKADLAKKKQGINLINYLEEKGSVPKPWDPNNPKPKDAPPKPKGPQVGADGLTDAQRKRRELLMGPMPPIDHMPRLGKCPGNCYDPCNGQVCCSCFYNYYC